MAYDIRLSASKEYIIAVIGIPFKTDFIQHVAQEAVEFGLANGIKRVLYDLRNAKNISSIIENYKFAYQTAHEIPLVRTMRSAILADHFDTSHDFSEITMRNAGYSIRLFRDEQEAIAWLVN